jgi:quercetin dioxygenase-like cupin family protein
MTEKAPRTALGDSIFSIGKTTRCQGSAPVEGNSMNSIESRPGFAYIAAIKTLREGPMKRAALIVGVTFVAGAAVGVIADQLLSAQQEPVERKVLLKTDLEGIEGKEANVILVELAPGSASGKHYHSGHEIAYVLAGSATLEIEGKKPVTMKRGSVIHLTPKQVHDVKNPSKSAPMKALVFALYEKGQPIATPVK